MRAGLAELDGPALAGPGDGSFHLRSPHPIAETLPGVYRDTWVDERRRTAREPFGERFIAALDDVLAPVLATLDNLSAYFDPGTTPEDFLAWLGEWVAAPVDASWSEDRRRAFVAQAAELYRRRGTAAGLRDHLLIHTGGTVEIIENGASSWSAKPDAKLPGSPEAVVVVRITVDDPDSVDEAKLDALVAASKPAHVVHRLEILGAGQRAARKAKPAADAADDAPKGARGTAKAPAPGKAAPPSGSTDDEAVPGASSAATESTDAAGAADEAEPADDAEPKG